ncbi:sugar phosphate exchanger 3-like [Hydra vulgaris]|uniref:Sugar phosphate exchanger 3 n=1 Tax=Hydra vulgaris TaxID=6087 RepID=A0ABM4CDY9_HYDVU
MEPLSNNILAKSRNWSWHHVCVFILTYFSYAFFQASRVSLDNCKNTLNRSTILENTLKSSENNEDPIMFFEKLDITFSFAYAIGLYISGTMGDRLNLRYMLAFGMWSSAFTTLMIGYLSNKIITPNKYYYYSLSVANGLFQSIGWPVTVAIMGNWFISGDILYGIWGGSGNFGRIIGSCIINYSLNYNCYYGGLLNSSLLICGGVIVFFCLITYPNQVGLDERNLTNIRNNENKNHANVHIKKAVGFRKAFLMPGVPSYALSFFFVKMVNEISLFSLSTYLSLDPQWGDKESNNLISYYDLGTILGGIAAGILSKLIGIRSPVISLMLLSSIATILLNYKGVGFRTNRLIIFINGFLIGGPDNIISTAIPVVISKHQITNNNQALATVTGIIDGTGRFAAAISQCLILIIKKELVWNGVFYFLIFVVGCSCFWNLLILYKDLLDLSKKRNKNYSKL